MGLPQGTNPLNFTINIDKTGSEIEANSQPKTNRTGETVVRPVN